MKKLFIHQPLFRIFSPIFSGIIVYLLLLLLNNNVEQLKEQFLGEELYVCIGLSYIVQELSRFLLLVFKKRNKDKNLLFNIFFQVFVSLAISIAVVTISIIYYFKYIVGYSATSEDLITFNSIFSVIILVYILLFISHQYLHRINSEKLEQEELYKQNIEDDFRQFKRGINPHLLFESLEALIVLMHDDKDRADEFIDYLATIYRYVLSSKDKQLVQFEEELKHLKELEKLFNQLPYRKLEFTSSISTNFLIVPGSLLYVLEMIVRKTIISSSIKLRVNLVESKKEETIEFSYQTQDRLNSKISLHDLSEIERVYSIYSDTKIEFYQVNDSRVIAIPKLTTKQ